MFERVKKWLQEKLSVSPIPFTIEWIRWQANSYYEECTREDK